MFPPRVPDSEEDFRGWAQEAENFFSKIALVMASLHGWCEHTPAMTCLPCGMQEHRPRDVCVSDFADTPSTEPVGVVVDLMEDLQIDKIPEWFKKGYKNPVCLLVRALYGHPESGAHWERHV